MSSASEPTPLRALIRKLEGIATLSDHDRRVIASLSFTLERLGPRQKVVNYGDTAPQCCVILEGWVCCYRRLDEGTRQIMSFHIPGDLPDLQNFHLRVMDHSFATLTEVHVAFIPHDSLRDLILRFPSVAEVLWRNTLIDAAVFREWMVGIGRRSALGQIAHLICELYLKLHAVGLAENDRFSLPVTQNELGDALGLSYVHVDRVLQELRGVRVITLRDRTLVIEDWDVLVQIAEFDATYLHLEKRAGS